MLKVGVTGGIGSGKSVVCSIFEKLGVPVFNADLQAQSLLTASNVKDFYYTHWGEIVFTKGELDKQKIAQLIFNNQTALEKINHFIHPMVFQLFDQWCLHHEHSKYVIKEAALLFESGAYANLDLNIIVCAPVELRIKRVMHRNQLSKEQVVQRINNQWEDELKKPLAQFIIENNDTNPILKQVLEIHELLLNK